MSGCFLRGALGVRECRDIHEHIGRDLATERKHLPDADVTAAGGWRSLDALKRSYQHADPDTMLRVVMEPGQLRAAK